MGTIHNARALFSAAARLLLLAASATALDAATTARASAQSASFSYQGQLSFNGAPASGLFDMQFRVFTASSGGSQIGEAVCANDVQVQNGLFTVVVPLAVLSSGQPHFLEVAARVDVGQACSDPTGYIALAARQAVTPVPVAVAASVITQQSPSVPGALRFNAAEGRFEGFNGGFWVPLTQGDELPPANTRTFGVGTGSFTVPAGVTRIGVSLAGGGGGGGSRTASPLPNCVGSTGATAGFGGGSGAVARAWIDVTPGETLAVIVGAAGSGGQAPGLSGQAGGSSIIRRGAVNLVIAGGGGGGPTGTLASAVSGSPSCSLPAGTAPENAGTASVAPSGVVPILLRSGASGGVPTRMTCLSPASVLDLGCPGAGGASISVTSVVPANSGSGGSGGQNSSAASFGVQGGAGSATIWWD